eukprot:5877036-Amphidinium_carterae.1
MQVPQLESRQPSESLPLSPKPLAQQTDDLPAMSLEPVSVSAHTHVDELSSHCGLCMSSDSSVYFHHQ